MTKAWKLIPSSPAALKTRWRYAFIKTYKPVIDDGFPAFGTMEDYRRWCEENLPRWLGYYRAEPGLGKPRIEIQSQSVYCRRAKNGDLR